VDLGKKGIQAVVIESAGFAETGEEGFFLSSSEQFDLVIQRAKYKSNGALFAHGLGYHYFYVGETAL
jgi:accessory colonization factor AcfC